MNLSQISLQANNFLTKAFHDLERIDFKLDDHWHIDHLCYRTSTPEMYLSTKNHFACFANLLIESEVNGRLISTFKLPTPIHFREWQIDLIEVPAPKAGKSTTDGFEHFEVVCDLTFDELKSRYGHCQYNESGLTKCFNQELEFLFEGFALKFHHLSLESVINLETNTPVFSALKKSSVLDLLKDFKPLIAGTFPLNINVAGSDIDMLISTDNFDLVKKILRENFSTLANFKVEENMVLDEPTLLATFTYEKIDFEIFGQKTMSVKQRGYLHFLAEERLLKLGGASFMEKVREARRLGLKTEPAFAKALKLSEDPFEELLVIQKKSSQELKSLLVSIT